MAIFAPLLAPADPKKNDITNRLSPPFETSENLLGTDGLGKDVLSRLIYGARTIIKVTV
ncbi:MAG: D,D-dipeptide ABC transporter permease, partial [Chloroflexi bacterium]|nr:D,D-dipeptide ABC transporter permease [Chloroflexota bacterium]